jgi:hypothetical protein
MTRRFPGQDFRPRFRAERCIQSDGVRNAVDREQPLPQGRASYPWISAISFDSCARIDDKPGMPKKPGTNPKGEFAFFNVVYEDDSVRSNRRVPSELLGGLDGDEPARAFIHEQDREIAEKSGRPALEIKSISRVGAKKK